jgi:hypothetical protein
VEVQGEGTGKGKEKQVRRRWRWGWRMWMRRGDGVIGYWSGPRTANGSLEALLRSQRGWEV